MRNGLTPELVEKYFVELWDEICVAAAVNRICLSATESATERGKSSPSTSLLVKRLGDSEHEDKGQGPSSLKKVETLISSQDERL